MHHQPALATYLIVIPAYNEEAIIQETLLALDYFLDTRLPEHEIKVVVSDNNSSDTTRERVMQLMERMPRLSYHFVPQQGKGVAIKSAWEQYLDEYEYFIFMDADLATDLEALPRLFEELTRHEVVVGDRYHRDSIVERTLKRRVISRVYRMLITTLLRSRISDYPCGFKGVRREVVREIVPQVANTSWFFDSELVCRAERNGLAVCSIPVKWRDPRSKMEQSKVNIPRVSAQYLTEVIRLMREK